MSFISISACVFILNILSFFFLFAQNNSLRATTLLKGKVVERSTNRPLETKFILVDESGKIIKIKTGSDGSFHMPINQAGRYKIFSDDWLALEPEEIEINSTQTYYEKEVVVYILHFKPGQTIKNVIGFGDKPPFLKPEGKKVFTILKELNQYSPKLFFKILLKINESNFTTQTKTIKEGKKNKKIILTPRQQAQELAEKWIEETQNFLNSLKFPKRKYKISVEYLHNPIKSKAIKKKSKEKESFETTPEANLEIIIDSILNLDLDKN
ncbi:MAG: hypothetical protein N2517_04855 [Ignavibacteria bacterium]|nr:hypothetical protein [Ignavibacteria bacterium]